MIIGNVISPLSKKGGAAPSDADAEAYFVRAAAAGAAFADGEKAALTSLFIYLKSEKGTDGVTSLWDSLDVLNLPGATKAILALNIKTAAFGNITWSTDTGAYIAYKGYAGNGVNTRANSGFNPFDGLNVYKFKANDNCFGVCCHSNSMEIKSLVSTLDASSRGYELRTHTVLAITINGTAAENTVDACDGTGLFSSKRLPTVNTWGVSKNSKPGTSPTSAVSASISSGSAGSFRYFCRNINGAFSLFSTSRIKYAFYGSSNIDTQKLDRAINTLWLKPMGGAFLKRVVFDGNSFLQQVTMPKRVISDLWTAGIECTSLFNGVFGIKWPAMTSNAAARVDAYLESYYTHQCFIAWENTNDIATVSGTVPQDVYDHQKTYIAARRAAGWDNIIISTCIPATSITEAERENIANWNDTATLNGKIRNGWSADLLADSLADPSQDARFEPGDTGGSDYSGDGVHLSSTGYNYLATTYLTPPAQTFLT